MDDVVIFGDLGENIVSVCRDNVTLHYTRNISSFASIPATFTTVISENAKNIAIYGFNSDDKIIIESNTIDLEEYSDDGNTGLAIKSSKSGEILAVVYDWSDTLTLRNCIYHSRIESDESDTTINGSDLRDIIVSGGNNVIVNGNAGDDILTINGNNSSVFGGNQANKDKQGLELADFPDGNDKIIVNGNNVYAHGGTGVDTISVYGSDVTVNGGSAFDYLPVQDIFYIG